MANKRRIEIFTAGCPLCDDAVQSVRRLACESCEIEIRDLNDEEAARKAAELGVRFAPAVVIDGKLSGCCTAGGVDEEVLRAEGVGQPL